MVSYSRLVEVTRDLLDLTISGGAIVNTAARVAEPFAAAAETIAATARTAPVIHSDESSARVEGRTRWQWVFDCATAVAHIIAPSRGNAVITLFLSGATPKVWVSDIPPRRSSERSDSVDRPGSSRCNGAPK